MHTRIELGAQLSKPSTKPSSLLNPCSLVACIPSYMQGFAVKKRDVSDTAAAPSEEGAADPQQHQQQPQQQQPKQPQEQAQNDGEEEDGDSQGAETRGQVVQRHKRVSAKMGE